MKFLLSRFPVGSSATIIFGLVTKARQIAALLSLSPEHSLGYLFKICSTSNRFAIFATAAFISTFDFPANVSGTAIFSKSLVNLIN